MTAPQGPGFLPELRSAAESAFASLRAEFDLEALPDTGRPHPRENSVSFRNRHLRIDLFFEAGAPEIAAGIAEYEPGSDPPRVRRACPLAYLLPRREPGSEDALRWPREPGEPLAAVLARIALLLRRHAADLLAGDSRCLDEPCALAAADRRSERRRRFGTSTGETPRFDRRPSLAELFSDVTTARPGLTSARCCQAVHDYGYSRTEVASFLRAPECDVDRMLAEW